MIEILLIIIFALLILNTFLTFRSVAKSSELPISEIKAILDNFAKELLRLETQIRDEFLRNREETNKNFIESRKEISENFSLLTNSVSTEMKKNSDFQRSQFEIFSSQMNNMYRVYEERLDKLFNLVDNELKEFDNSNRNISKENREELKNSLKSFEESFKISTSDFSGLLKEKFTEFTNRQNELIKLNDETLEKLRLLLETKIQQLQEDNNRKLEEMRLTVDEKLQSTVEKRFNESFKLISDRLELVHKGLGEMQTLAIGVGDLKKVLSNVKTKGILGEYQLENLLEQILTPDQYAKNINPKSSGKEVVEFAVKLPGKDDLVKHIWLPIDSKFPLTDYEELLKAYDIGDKNLIESYQKNLENKIKSFAKDIHDKYIDPPNTTDFAIMFLPFESLYAEVLRSSGLFNQIQRDYKVIITGPTTLSAILNSLQMGFRTLAIEKRSSEVWKILGAIKTEFGKFGDILEKTSKKLMETQKELDNANVRTRQIERKLNKVQELPSDVAQNLLELDKQDNE